MKRFLFHLLSFKESGIKSQFVHVCVVFLMHFFFCRAWSSSIPSLKYIKDLPKLKRLSLIQVPLQVDGRFLIDVTITRKLCLAKKIIYFFPF